MILYLGGFAMKDFYLKLKNDLKGLIADMEKCSYIFVKNPQTDFTRNRSLSFSTTINLLLSMGGNSLNKELLEYFNYDEKTVTASAFVQQRNKLLPFTFEFLLNAFNKNLLNNKLYKGYRLLAVDGSDTAYAANIDNTENYFQNNENTR